jgi:hypothetical protein
MEHVMEVKMPAWLSHAVFTAVTVLVALAGMGRTGYAYFPTGDIFEIRPSRVRIATPDEINGTAPLWHNFPLSEPLPASATQDSLRLTESDSLAVVLPVRNWANSDMSIYRINSIIIGEFDITLDYYIFEHPYSGSLDSFSPPSEQIVLLGTLPAGDYDFNVRRWYLNYEDRFGFDESEIESWSAPEDGGFYTLPDRFVTDDRFTFTVLAVAVPEPTTMTILLFTSLLVASRKICLRRLTRRCS